MAKVTATADMEVPSSDVAYPMKNRRKVRPRSTAARRMSAAMPLTGP
jgi:hypothetical protein